MDNPGCLWGWFHKLIDGMRRISNPSPSYQLVESLLSPSERSFYHVLAQCVPTGWTIVIKVRLADILKPRDKHGSTEYWTAFNRIKAKHIDFVICDAKTLQPLLAIELDDKSHQQSRRAARDDFLDQAFREANFPIIHIRARQSYNIQGLTNQIMNTMR